jgi:hypothetical protein
MDAAVSGSLTVDKREVALTVQGDGTFFTSRSTTDGSAILLANGLRIAVTNSAFDEAGCRNSLTLWGGAVFLPAPMSARRLQLPMVRWRVDLLLH